ncbi:MAG: tail fiber domain-containing protein [Chitinophagaceae bacterium]
MKKYFTTVLWVLCMSKYTHAQTGIGTVSPNSTLDVRGSISSNFRSVTSSTSLLSTDNKIAFTGASAATITLPDASNCAGRSYCIKNVSTTLPVPVCTIATSLSQTIENVSSWFLSEANKSVTMISNGANWYIASQYLPAGAGTEWSQNGNSVVGERRIGTISNYDFPFITNNTEKMRLTAAGNAAIGTTAFDAINPEKLLVDAGTTTSFNAISGKGSINNYLQLNIQNRSAGNSASSDIVASNNSATESVNYVDLGINSGGFSNATYPVLDGPNNSYLYSTGNDFIIGNGTANKNLSFFTCGYAALNERIRVTGAGLVGIDNTNPLEKLDVNGNIRLSGLNASLFFDASVDPYAGIKNISKAGEVNELLFFCGNDPVGTYGADRIRLASHELHFATAPTSSGINAGDATAFFESTVNAPTRMLINENGNVAIGTTAFNPTNPEALLVDAGVTSSYNAISGKGSINNYLQLNIQNNSNGASASSDIVATADNGTETINFVDLGINSDSYTGAGILSGANNAYLYSTGNDFIIGNATAGKSLIFYTTVGATSTQRMSVTNAGLIPAQNNAYALGSSTNRSTAIWAVNGVIQTSDARLKNNIHALRYGLKEVLLLNPVAYNWIDEKDPANKIGLIAQEVRKVIPEVVVGDEKKEKLGMNYAEMVPVLINAIRELKTKVEVLRKKAIELRLIN